MSGKMLRTISDSTMLGVTKMIIFIKNDCLFGCPCESFECQPDKKSVLVLNTRATNKPVLIKFDG